MDFSIIFMEKNTCPTGTLTRALRANVLSITLPYLSARSLLELLYGSLRVNKPFTANSNRIT